MSAWTPRQIETGNQRLLALADFLDTLPPERFDFSTWVGRDWKGAQDLSCGTTACAMGWATTMPRFRRLGLRLRATDYRRAVPTFEGHTCEDAAAALFRLDGLESMLLFIPGISDRDAPEWSEDLSRYATAREVADQLRRFVNHRRAAA